MTEPAHSKGDTPAAAAGNRAARGSQHAPRDVSRGARAGDKFVAKATDPSADGRGSVPPMKFGLREGAGVLFAALAAGGAGLAWHGAEGSALAAARAECHALLGVVASGVEASIAASSAVETLLGERLLGEAHAVAEELARNPGLEEETLRRSVEEQPSPPPPIRGMPEPCRGGDARDHFGRVHPHDRLFRVA